jgi:hypothetical protein
MEQSADLGIREVIFVGVVPAGAHGEVPGVLLCR